MRGGTARPAEAQGSEGLPIDVAVPQVAAQVSVIRARLRNPNYTIDQLLDIYVDCAIDADGFFFGRSHSSARTKRGMVVGRSRRLS